MESEYVTVALPVAVRWWADEEQHSGLRPGRTSLVIDLARAAGAGNIFGAATVTLDQEALVALPAHFGELGGPPAQLELASWIDAILLAQLVLRVVAEGVENIAPRALRRATNPQHIHAWGEGFPAAREGNAFDALLREQRIGERRYVLTRWLGRQLEVCAQQGEVTGPLRVASADQRHATPDGANMCIEASLYAFVLLWTLHSLAHPGKLRVCRSCRHVFEQRHGRQSHCSDACKMREYRARKRGA